MIRKVTLLGIPACRARVDGPCACRAGAMQRPSRPAARRLHTNTDYISLHACELANVPTGPPTSEWTRSRRAPAVDVAQISITIRVSGEAGELDTIDI